ncbi:MAG: hypothetical protein Kow00104_01050 [Rhodothalassiaceae bacterium]
MTILVVDDEPALARLYGAAIARRGFDVLTARSGAEALETVATRRIRLILSDIEMPGMSGLEMGRRRRPGRGVPGAPLVFLTAHDSVDLLAEGLRAGGDDFLAKGGPLEQAMERIVFWLSSGFRRLPAEARRSAIAALETLDPRAPILGRIHHDRAAFASAFEVLWREVQATPSGFGDRLIDRIRIMGRASALLAERAGGACDHLRYPDALMRMLLRLRMPWSGDCANLFAHYDLLARDRRFLEAGARGLSP